MTVKELCEAINAKFPDPNTEVGIALSNIAGWIQGVARITTDEKGRCIIDQTDESLDEVDIY